MYDDEIEAAYETWALHDPSDDEAVNYERAAFFAGWQKGYERGHADGGRLHTPGKDPWRE